MKKYILYFIISVLFLPRYTVYASDSFYYGDNQKQMYLWYMDEADSSIFKLTSDLIVDDSNYSNFVETSTKKQIDTGHYSLIFKTSACFDNLNLTIIGSGLDVDNKSHPVLQLDSDENSTIKYLKVVAKEGDGVYIGQNQMLETNLSLNKDFPIIFDAQNYALIYESDERIEFNTIKLITAGQNAIMPLPNPNRNPDNVCFFTYSEINRLENPQQYFYTYCYINEEWMNRKDIVTDSINNEILSFDDEKGPLYIKDMSNLEDSLSREINVEWSAVDVLWDISQVDFDAKTNTIQGQLLINPRFSPLIKTDINLNVYEVKNKAINDFQISDCFYFSLNGTYRVRFKMTYPYGYEDASFQASMDNINYKNYKDTLLFYLETRYDKSYTAELNYQINELTALLPDKTYYFRVLITGGVREGYSNTIKFENGVWEVLETSLPTLPKPDEDKPDTIPPEIDKPNEESSPKEPDIEVGKPNGDDGHRGDENRDDVPEEDNQIIIKEEQLQGLEKAGEDIMMMIDNTQFIISHEQIQEWSQQNEEVTLTLEDEQINYKSDSQEKRLLDTDVTIQNQVKQADSLFSWQLILGGIVIFIAIGNLYSRRKRRGE